MASYVLQNIKWGTPALGTAAGQVTWSFATTVGAFYNYDAQISAPAYQALIRQAFDAWESVAKIDFVEVGDSQNVNIRLGWDVIDGPSGTLGEASSSYYLGPYNTFDKAEIAFDIDEDWSTLKVDVPFQINFYSVALHEIGHAIGLSHSSDPSTIMYAFQNEQVNLTAGDIAGVQVLYGASAAPPPSGDISGTQGPDFLEGTLASNRIVGLGGNDVLFGDGGDDTLDGGTGIDSAFYLSGRSSFSIQFAGNGQVTVLDLTGAEGRDTLIGIERLDFADGILALDLEGNAGQAYRIYQAAFDRVPDNDGLAYWIGAMDDGTDLYTVGRGFVASQEFISVYGAGVVSSDFVDRLYQNILGRPGETAGINFWTSEIDSGRSDFSQVLIGFSESPENKSGFYQSIGDGIWYT